MAESKNQLEDKEVEAVSGGFFGNLFEKYGEEALKEHGITADRHVFGHNKYYVGKEVLIGADAVNYYIETHPVLPKK